jgi:hypothetical protein
VSDDDFLSRWSKRKHVANRGEALAEPAPARPVPPMNTEAAPPVTAESPPPLPDTASLTPESDFTPFMREGVPESLKRQALKTLFQDPRFNVMDGLDVYIDDYSKPDPLPEGWLEKMNQVARLGEYREPEAEAAKVSPDQAETTAQPLSEAAPEADSLPPAPDTAAPRSDTPEVPESRGKPA